MCDQVCFKSVRARKRMLEKTGLSEQTGVSFDSYIIRLHRFQKSKPQTLQGIVEEVGTAKKSAFANYDELWGILNSPKGRGKNIKKKSCSQKRRFKLNQEEAHLL